MHGRGKTLQQSCYWHRPTCVTTKLLRIFKILNTLGVDLFSRNACVPTSLLIGIPHTVTKMAVLDAFTLKILFGGRPCTGGCPAPLNPASNVVPRGNYLEALPCLEAASRCNFTTSASASNLGALASVSSNMPRSCWCLDALNWKPAF